MNLDQMVPKFQLNPDLKYKRCKMQIKLKSEIDDRIKLGYDTHYYHS